MYLHAGNNKLLRVSDIIGIFDMDSSTMEETTRRFLRKAEKEGRMINIKEELPKSFILTKEEKVYVSQISTKTMVGRVKNGIKF